MRRPMIGWSIAGLVGAGVIMALIDFTNWWALVPFGAAGLLGMVSLLVRPWKPTPGTTPEARQAQARLMSTRNINAR